MLIKILNAVMLALLMTAIWFHDRVWILIMILAIVADFYWFGYNYKFLTWLYKFEHKVENDNYEFKSALFFSITVFLLIFLIYNLWNNNLFYTSMAFILFLLSKLYINNLQLDLNNESY